MKTKLLLLPGIIFLACISFSGCNKESISTKRTNEVNELQSATNKECKLTHNVWGYLFTWDFHYNEKGFADTWTIDYGYQRDRFQLKYNTAHKLTEANDYDTANNLIFNTKFFYKNNRIYKETWTDILAGTSFVTLFTHNNKGQIVREDDNVNDTHIFLYYDNWENCTRSDYYIGKDLYFSDNYEFNVKVQNPLLTVTGVDFMFPYTGVGYFNTLWFSRNLSIVYDDLGNPFTINDFTAAKKDFETGYKSFPFSANFLDAVSATPLDFIFGYSCDDSNNFKTQPNNSNNIIGSPKYALPLINMHLGASLKEQLLALRQQVKMKH